MNESLVYLNGAMIPASQARLAIYDAGIVWGATVTEMTRTFGKRPWRLDDHLARLYRSLRYTRMDIGMSREQLAIATEELVEQNAQRCHSEDELGIIHFVTAGEFPVYAGSAGKAAAMTPTVCIHTFPMPFELWVEKLARGQHLVTPSIRHVPPQCYDPKMKYRSRMHYYLADKEAQLVDPEASALLLDLQGNLTETSGSNVMLVQRGTIATPTTVNSLPGISRETVRQLAVQHGVEFVERDLQVHDAMNADEMFTSSTPYCLLPVTRVNGVLVGSGVPGPYFHRLLAAWSELVGLDIAEQIRRGAERRQK